MTKHLVDIDDETLERARVTLGTTTIDATVHAALQQAGTDRVDRIGASLDDIAAANLDDRARAWRH